MATSTSLSPRTPELKADAAGEVPAVTHSSDMDSETKKVLDAGAADEAQQQAPKATAAADRGPSSASRLRRVDSKGVYCTGAPIGSFADVDIAKVHVSNRQTTFRVDSCRAHDRTQATMGLNQSLSANTLQALPPGRLRPGTAATSATPLQSGSPSTSASAWAAAPTTPGMTSASPVIPPKPHGGGSATFVSGAPFALDYSLLPPATRSATCFKVKPRAPSMNSLETMVPPGRMQPAGTRKRAPTMNSASTVNSAQRGTAGTAPSPLQSRPRTGSGVREATRGSQGEGPVGPGRGMRRVMSTNADGSATRGTRRTSPSANLELPGGTPIGGPAGPGRGMRRVISTNADSSVGKGTVAGVRRSPSPASLHAPAGTQRYSSVDRGSVEKRLVAASAGTGVGDSSLGLTSEGGEGGGLIVTRKGAGGALRSPNAEGTSGGEAILLGGGNGTEERKSVSNELLKEVEAEGKEPAPESQDTKGIKGGEEIDHGTDREEVKETQSGDCAAGAGDLGPGLVGTEPAGKEAEGGTGSGGEEKHPLHPAADSPPPLSDLESVYGASAGHGTTPTDTSSAQSELEDGVRAKPLQQSLEVQQSEQGDMSLVKEDLTQVPARSDKVGWRPASSHGRLGRRAKGAGGGQMTVMLTSKSSIFQPLPRRPSTASGVRASRSTGLPMSASSSVSSESASSLALTESTASAGTVIPLGPARSAETPGRHDARLRRPGFKSLPFLSRSLSVPRQESDSREISPAVSPPPDLSLAGDWFQPQCFPSFVPRKQSGRITNGGSSLDLVPSGSQDSAILPAHITQVGRTTFLGMHGVPSAFGRNLPWTKAALRKQPGATLAQPVPRSLEDGPSKCDSIGADSQPLGIEVELGAAEADAGMSGGPETGGVKAANSKSIAASHWEGGEALAEGSEKLERKDLSVKSSNAGSPEWSEGQVTAGKQAESAGELREPVHGVSVEGDSKGGALGSAVGSLVMGNHPANAVRGRSAPGPDSESNFTEDAGESQSGSGMPVETGVDSEHCDVISEGEEGEGLELSDGESEDDEADNFVMTPGILFGLDSVREESETGSTAGDSDADNDGNEIEEGVGVGILEEGDEEGQENGSDRSSSPLGKRKDPEAAGGAEGAGTDEGAELFDDGAAASQPPLSTPHGSTPSPARVSAEPDSILSDYEDAESMSGVEVLEDVDGEDTEDDGATWQVRGGLSPVSEHLSLEGASSGDSAAMPFQQNPILSKPPSQFKSCELNAVKGGPPAACAILEQGDSDEVAESPESGALETWDSQNSLVSASASEDRSEQSISSDTTSALGVWSPHDTSAAEQLSMAMELLLSATRPIAPDSEGEEEGGEVGSEADYDSPVRGGLRGPSTKSGQRTVDQLRAASELLLLASQSLERKQRERGKGRGVMGKEGGEKRSYEGWENEPAMGVRAHLGG